MSRRVVVGCVAAAAVLSVAACGSDSDPAPVSVTTDRAAADQATTTVPATSDVVVAAEDRCTDDELSLNAGRGEGSAGSVTVPLVFANTGDRPCVLQGFPGVSYVTGENGTEVGAAASRSGTADDAVTLRPGGRATAVVRAVQVMNYPEDECGPTEVAGLRVYAPNDSVARFVPYPATACSLTGVDQLQVTAVSAQ